MPIPLARTIAISFVPLIIFAIDVLLQIHISTVLYIPFMYLSMLEKDKSYTIVAWIVSLLFTIIGWMFSVENIFSYDTLTTLIVLFSVIISGGMIISQQEKEDEVRKLKDSLELRVLARTSSSEARVAILERQIEILQTIKVQKTAGALLKLDGVISDLKKLSKEEAT